MQRVIAMQQASTITLSDPSGEPIDPSVHKSELQFHRLLDKLPAGAYTCDPQGLITYFNQQAAVLWGREPRLNDLMDRFCGSYKLFSADGTLMTHAQSLMALALQTRKDAGGEMLIERPDGMLCTVLAHASPIIDDSGVLQGAVNVLIDITDRKIAEVELRYQHELTRAITDNSPSLFFVMDNAGRVTFANPSVERITGYTISEFMGEMIHHKLHHTHPDGMAYHISECPIFHAAQKCEVLNNHEDVFVRKDGTFFPVRCTITPLYKKGVVVGSVAEVHDITDQKLTEKALKEADEKKDEFLAILAHELRNPLAPIRNALYILRSDRATETMRLEAREMMERQVEQMVRLVDDLMDVSRITCGKVALQKEPVQLADIIHNAVETSRPLIEEQGHSLSVNLSAEPIYLHADLTRLSQVFSNLLNNAAKYMEQGGLITLNARVADGQVIVCVADTGIGIVSDMLPRVFEMFAQASNSLEKAHGGLGIGLTLVKNLVEMHGGNVSAQSTGLNQGSQFTVSLPIIEAESVQAGDQAEHMLSSPSMSAMRILVVDDNEASAKTMGWTVELLGYDVRLAHEGLEALAIAKDFKPHVVLLDIGLPGMNGYEVCERMRQEPDLTHTVFVAQTGWGQSKHRVLSKKAGFDHHLVKPVDMESLRELLYSLNPELQAA